MEEKNYKITINGNNFSLIKENLIAESLELTKLEQRALVVLIRNEKKVTSKRTFTESVWGHINVSDSSIRKLISILRQKLDDSDGEVLITERGNGYRLNFNKKEFLPPQKHTVTILSALALLCLVAFAFVIGRQSNLPDSELKPIKYDWIATFDKAILRYQKYNDAYYVLTDDLLLNDSAIFEIKNDTVKEVYRADNFNDFLLDFSISPGGKSLVRVSHSESCEVIVFEDLFTTIHSTLPCYKFMPASNYHWLDDEKFLFTHKTDPSKSVRPAIYELPTKSINKLSDWPINYNEAGGQDDIEILPYKDGFFTIRSEDQSYREFSLRYFSPEYAKEFKTKIGLDIAINGNTLYYFNEHNQMQIADIRNIESNSFKFEFKTIMNSTPLYSFQPKYFDNELHFINGTWNQIGLYSNTSKNMITQLETTHKISVSSRGLLILKPREYGYEVLEISSDSTNHLKIKTELDFTFVNFIDEQYFLAGKDGIYVYNEGKLTSIYTKPVTKLAVFETPIIESEDSIYKVNDAFDLETIAIGASGLTQTKTGYFYIENITNRVVNQSGETIATAFEEQILFSVDDKAVTGSRTENGAIDIVDISSNETIAQLDFPLLNFNLVQYGSIIYYTSGGKTHNTIVKVIKADTDEIGHSQL